MLVDDSELSLPTYKLAMRIIYKDGMPWPGNQNRASVHVLAKHHRIMLGSWDLGKDRIGIAYWAGESQRAAISALCWVFGIVTLYPAYD